VSIVSAQPVPYATRLVDAYDIGPVTLVTRSIAVLVFNGFADWEPAYALTGARRWGRRSVTAVGYDRTTVVSMGGLRVEPEAVLERVTPATTELLLLPGGDTWLDAYPASRLERVLGELTAASVPVGAICAATVAVARAGLLSGRRHTSNGAAYLQRHAPGYETPALYVETLAVSDSGVITASGLGAVEFAREIFAALGIFKESDLAAFVDMYRGGHIPRPDPSAPTG
jgi:putative intracellular protease/amidase